MHRWIMAAVLAVLLAGIVGCGGGGSAPPISQDVFDIPGSSRAQDADGTYLWIPTRPKVQIQGNDPDAGIWLRDIGGQQIEFIEIGGDQQVFTGFAIDDYQPRQIIAYLYGSQPHLIANRYYRLRDPLGRLIGPRLRTYTDGREGPSMIDCSFINVWPLHYSGLTRDQWANEGFEVLARYINAHGSQAQLKVWKRGDPTHLLPLTRSKGMAFSAGDTRAVIRRRLNPADVTGGTWYQVELNVIDAGGNTAFQRSWQFHVW